MGQQPPEVGMAVPVDQDALEWRMLPVHHQPAEVIWAVVRLLFHARALRAERIVPLFILLLPDGPTHQIIGVNE
jgi:hypothetical protein